MLKIGFKNDGVCRRNGILFFYLQTADSDVKNVYFTLSAPEIFRGPLKKKSFFISYLGADSFYEFNIPYRCMKSFNLPEGRFQVDLQYVDASGGKVSYSGSFCREFDFDDAKNVTIINNTTLNASGSGIAYAGSNNIDVPDLSAQKDVFLSEIKLRQVFTEAINVPVLVQLESGKELERGIYNSIKARFVPCFAAGEAHEFKMLECRGTFGVNGVEIPFAADRFYAADEKLCDYRYTAYTAGLMIDIDASTSMVNLTDFFCSFIINGKEFCCRMVDGTECSFAAVMSPEEFDGSDFGTLPVCRTEKSSVPQPKVVKPLKMMSQISSPSLKTAASKGDELQKAHQLFGVSGSGLDPERAFTIFSERCRSGNADALTTGKLGECYIAGIGTAADAVKGAELLKKSADAGSAEFALKYAECCLNGIGVEKDEKSAVRYLQDAMAKGNTTARSKYAFCLLKNCDYAGAAENFESSSGCVDSVYALGCMNYFGLGMSENRKSALEYFEKAAAQGHPGAKVMAAKCILKHGETSGCNVSGAEYLADFKADSSPWDGTAFELLGSLAKDANRLRESVEYFIQSSRLGNIDAVYQLAMSCLNRVEGAGDVLDGIELLEIAASSGHQEALIELMECYLRGRGVSRDYIYAVDLLKKIKCQDAPRVLFLEGMMHYHGMGLPENEAEGMKFLQQSAEAGYEPAVKYLASIK